MANFRTKKKTDDQISISFKTKAIKINDWVIIRLPAEDSAKLPSRGQNMVEGTINQTEFSTPLEPDGNWNHWFSLTPELRKKINLDMDKTVDLKLTTVKQWPDPQVPQDLMAALKNSKPALASWQTITPMARWEWVRWLRSTANPATREKRIKVAVSKLNSGERRPCCWNRNLCTEPSISKNGVLLKP